MKCRLDSLCPVGLDPMRELLWFFIGVGASTLYSLKFIFSLLSIRSNLLYSLERLPAGDAAMLTMPCFSALMNGATIGFLLVALCMPALALVHYLYHYQGSRSIYLMRRLPQRWELARRCLALPVLGAATALLCGLVITLLWMGLYLFTTPRELLSPLWYL